jgi:hypothetical protein
MANRYWVLGTGAWDGTSTTNWSTTSGGAGGASVPTAADNVFFDANSNIATTAFTVTITTVAGLCNDFTASGLDGTMTLAGTVGLTVSGSLTFQATNFTRTYTGTTTFNATTTGKTVTTNGVAFGGNVTFDGVGGAWALGSAFNIPNNQRLFLNNGTLDLNGLVLTAGLFTTGAGTKNITFNGGTFAISGATTTTWNNAAPTGFTTTAGTGTGSISMTSASAKTFVGGGSTYNCTLNQGGAGTLTISGSNTFSNITNTTQPAQITFTASTTNTFSNFSLSGTAGNLITLRSSSSGTRFTLSKSSGTVSVSYLDIQDSAATGGASWRSLLTNGNINSGNNTGWIFTSGGGNFLMLF